MPHPFLKPPTTVRIAGRTLIPVEPDASRRDAERAVNANQLAAARFAFGHAALTPDTAIAAIEAGIMVPQPAQQQQAQAGAAMSAREVAAARVSVGRLLDKAGTASNPVDAARLRAAADRIAGDIAESGVRAWIQTSPTRRDLIDAQGGVVGTVTRLYGRWYADLAQTEAHSPTTRTDLGCSFVEAEAKATVERYADRPPQQRRAVRGARATPDTSERLGPADCLDAGYGRAA